MRVDSNNKEFKETKEGLKDMLEKNKDLEEPKDLKGLEEKANEIQKKMDLANVHRQTGVLFSEYLEPRININVVDDIMNHVRKTGYNLTATGYSESALASSYQDFIGGLSL